jgi:hypothetical protein
VTSPGLDNLTSTVFRALYPEYDLTTVGNTYIVYAPPGAGPLLYASDSLGVIAQQISDLEGVELADLMEDATDPLPRRNHP